jgi:hypothetical protein
LIGSYILCYFIIPDMFLTSRQERPAICLIIGMVIVVVIVMACE